MDCNVCRTPLGDPIYDAGSDRALTSLCETRPGHTRVWSCVNCGHLRGEALDDTDRYYESGYRILLDQDDEDQIYEVHGDRIVYRTDHQVSTLTAKLALPEGALLLDYGCAKASTPQRLLGQRPDLQVHLFDVSAMYTAHWDRFVAPERRAIHHTPPQWQGRFDAVTSFFALEHIPDPGDTVGKVARLLKADGVFYGIVPDTFGNVADFVVVDHVNHFTASSLHALLRRAGFASIEIDAAAHRGALVFVARKQGPHTPCPDVQDALQRSHELARYWAGLETRIAEAERAAGGAPAAVYGSGFYGAYIASTLRSTQPLRCFLDRSPFQQGKTLFGKPVLAPEQLPDDVRTLYVGLNPAIARAAMQQMDWLRARGVQLVYLDGAPA
jgi:SAM-dependent methyltransferase